MGVVESWSRGKWRRVRRPGYKDNGEGGGGRGMSAIGGRGHEAKGG